MQLKFHLGSERSTKPRMNEAELNFGHRMIHDNNKIVAKMIENKM